MYYTTTIDATNTRRSAKCAPW